jgi:hypothetical protein
MSSDGSLDYSTHSTSSSLLESPFHNVLISASRQNVQRSCWSTFILKQTIAVDDAYIYKKNVKYQASGSNGIYFSGVGGIRSALFSGAFSADELDQKLSYSRLFLLVDVNGDILVNPRSLIFFAWQLLGLSCALLCALFVPIEVAFSTTDLTPGTQLTGAFFELFFLLDMSLNFNLPIYDKSSGCIISNRKLILNEYLKYWFWVDLASCVPLDICEVLIGPSRIHSVDWISSVISAIRILKIFKLLRLLRADAILTSLQGHLTLQHWEVESLKLLFLLLMTIHFMGCGLFIVADWEDTQRTWLEENNLLRAPASVRYTCALYWATMTATTIGYGDIVLATPFERSYATLCMITGASIYAFITSRLVGMLLFPGTSPGHRHADIHLALRRIGGVLSIHRAVLMDYVDNKDDENGMDEGTRELLKVSPLLSPFFFALHST